MEQINIVSIKTEMVCTKPCFTGWETSAVAPAFGADPIPASLEKSPRLIPCITQEPANPPAIALKSNAWLKISLNISGSWLRLLKVMYKPSNIYKIAMTGTTLELMIPIRWTPPKITAAVAKAKTAPITKATNSLFEK